MAVLQQLKKNLFFEKGEFMTGLFAHRSQPVCGRPFEPARYRLRLPVCPNSARSLKSMQFFIYCRCHWPTGENNRKGH